LRRILCAAHFACGRCIPFIAPSQKKIGANQG
jgi:hypothetical protein